MSFSDFFKNFRNRDLARRSFDTMAPVDEILRKAFVDIRDIDFREEDKNTASVIVRCENVDSHFYKTNGKWEYDGWEME